MTELRKRFEKEFFEQAKKEGKAVDGVMFHRFKKDFYIEWLENLNQELEKKVHLAVLELER
jgi:hypothetical protein